VAPRADGEAGRIWYQSFTGTSRRASYALPASEAVEDFRRVLAPGTPPSP
jgi:hypothetical protein